MLELRVHNLEGMAVLGRGLADCLREDASLRCILLRGDLGGGKTTLVRFLVEALPGGSKAEVASPSFTLCNIYPTTPLVMHCDLYRTGAAVPEELLETLDAGDMVALVEWAEHLPLARRPQDFLDICIQACDECRIVRIEAHSRNSARFEFLLRAVQSM
jgi:tRNA threonylcarbamoyladenosine biosynthesis protein TsaE